MILALLLLQAGASAETPPKPTVHRSAPERFSILLPDCPRSGEHGDVVVCAEGSSGQRLPLPGERLATGPHPSNPQLSGTGALAVGATPCAASQWGCQVGVGPPILPIAKALVGAAKSAFAKKPDKSGRIPIPLD